jgi:CheY-like chemotaxis protein
MDRPQTNTDSAQTILVVEDEASVLDLITFILEEAGYRVLQAANGAAGLSVLQMIQPDVIVSDVLMPGMDGLTFCERVRADADLAHIRPGTTRTMCGKA